VKKKDSHKEKKIMTVKNQNKKREMTPTFSQVF